MVFPVLVAVVAGIFEQGLLFLACPYLYYVVLCVFVISTLEVLFKITPILHYHTHPHYPIYSPHPHYQLHAHYPKLKIVTSMSVNLDLFHYHLTYWQLSFNFIFIYYDYFCVDPQHLH